MRVYLRLLAGLMLWPSVAMAEENGGYCPARIDVEQKLRAQPQGYEVIEIAGHTDWRGVTFFEGRPEQMVALKHDSEVDGADGAYVLTWNLNRDAEYWIECQYHSTMIGLWKKLPPVSECKVSVDPAQEIKLSCR